MGLVLTKEQILRDIGLNLLSRLVGIVERVLHKPGIALELNISDCVILALRLNLLNL